MRASVSVIRQAVTTESLFQILAGWCRDGAGRRTWSLRILSAFVSGRAVRALSPLIDVFLADGNSVEIIFGVDRGGTNRDALRHLSDLQRSYPGQANVQVFHAPSSLSIFHPKLYMLDTGRTLRVVIGSANLTLPGLSTNLESLVRYEGIGRDSAAGRAFLDIWRLFREPRQPLEQCFLKTIDDHVLAKYLNTLPKSHPDERGSKNKVQDLWRPLSQVPLPRSSTPIGKSISRGSVGYLIMDILKESRKSQVQIPLPVVEGFFGVPRAERRTINVSVVTDHGLTHPIERTIVHSGDMRRIEMPQIRNLERPLAVIFQRLQRKNRFAFYLVERSNPRFHEIDALLEAHGKQRRGPRRFIVGEVNDSLWSTVRTFLPEKAR